LIMLHQRACIQQPEYKLGHLCKDPGPYLSGGREGVSNSLRDI
jgi:hypothetical protein